MRVKLPAAPALPLAQAVSYTLPLPPSVNNLFATVGRKRIRTREYKAWQQEAGLRLLLQGVKHVPAPVKVRLEVVGKLHPLRDGDNLWKPILDLLVSAGVLSSDRFADVPWQLAWFRPTLGDVECVVHVEQAGHS